MSIQFIFTDTVIQLSERKRLKLFIERMFGQNKRDLTNLSIIFCTDEYLLDINKRFLQHDYFTDIITFNFSDDTNIIEAEIYISVDRIRENAADNKVSIKEELHRVIFHGVLHLCGYKDKASADKKEMTRLEDKSLNKFFASLK